MADWIDKTWAGDSVAEKTTVQYGAVMRYWDVWHRLRYGTPLPLALARPKAVGASQVNDFINDHTAIASNGRLQMRMSPAIAQGLRDADCSRADCVAPATTILRLQVLGKAHVRLRLPFDKASVRAKFSEIYAAYEAERAALGIPVVVPMSASNMVKALVAVCGDDREGIMDAALVHFLCRLKPVQIANLRFRELTPGFLKSDPEIDAVGLTLRHPIGAQVFEPNIVFIGDNALTIKRWGALREDEVQTDDWFFVRPVRGRGSAQINQLFIARRIRWLAQRAGLADAQGRVACSPELLRKSFERERHEDLPLTKVCRAARVGKQQATRMLRAARRDAR